ncbi:flagellar basal body rod protein FlgB [Domibacillus mangrovi]|uniref:Flagellar basal body rod protein FlgB n=1 Tax=Domibacillus mangrovi TaxID=1714354 RepID=A0A1Q5P4G8_9BACI|nr:flagellar basal body rod protein FlgB [Domibacillus mangrovi]OKL37144.1 flagellar basal body rod protein FlgB [Domibacillus mangrovi]
MNLFSSSITSLERGLNYASMQQKAIANNIANVDTPNYKSQEVSFKQALRKKTDLLQANRTNDRHFVFTYSSDGTIIAKKNLSYNESGNNVDIDQEMSDLAANQIYYNALTDRLSSKFSSLSNVIRGGR